MTILVARDLHKRFGGLVALAGVSLEVEQGEILGVIGPNGAGKTTLFHVLSGFLPPDGGKVLFRGQDITGLPSYAVAQLGLVRTFQLVRPFAGLTVLENVVVACTSPRSRRLSRGRSLQDRAWELLLQVGLAHRAAELVDHLPFGELKRLEIARALALSPDVLLLDEPFSGLSAAETGSLLELVRTLSQSGATLVVVEHKLRELMQLVRRVVVLDLGRVIATGTPEEVARNPAVVRAYLGGAA
jgi:branched-chain amino acid transport system ATP-binding protein